MKLVGARITEAREGLGLSVSALARLIGVARTMIYDYENETKQPSTATFIKLCDKLEQPEAFFYLPKSDTGYSHESAHYRSLETLSKDSRFEASTKFSWMMEYFDVLNKKVSLPKLNFPDIDVPTDLQKITPNFIEDATSQVRSFWGLEDAPLPNLVRLLEMNGVIVARTPLDISGMDGMSFWNHVYERPFILLNADKANHVRSRFDLAHELGHMILHRNMEKPASRGTPIYKKVERQAHFFAASLLLPRRTWLRDIETSTLAVFKFLKPKWKVSIIAQVMHAEALGAIDASRKRSLLKQISAKHWRQQEPFDDQWPPEQPLLFKQATELIAEKGTGTKSIMQAYPLRTGDLSGLTGLPPAFFDLTTLPLDLKSNSLGPALN